VVSQCAIVCVWQRGEFAGRERERLNYWREMLEEFEPFCLMPRLGLACPVKDCPQVALQYRALEGIRDLPFGMYAAESIEESKQAGM
jgi:hypothetical protein